MKYFIILITPVSDERYTVPPINQTIWSVQTSVGKSVNLTCRYVRNRIAVAVYFHRTALPQHEHELQYVR